MVTRRCHVCDGGGKGLQEIDCGTVLLAVDDFFRQLGLAEIRLRSGRDDKPLRMVKTLLHELCKKKVRRPVGI